jgi:hypothetical protein
MGKPAKKAADPVPTYTPTDSERQAAQRVLDRRTRTPPAPKFKIEVTGDKIVNISADHADPAICHTLLADAMGTGDYDFAAGLLAQLTDVSRSSRVATKQELDFILSVVRGISPRDETEALLAAQMAAIHNATMVAARRLNHVETVPQQDSASTMLNKLARTFANQVEALKKYRSAGEQTIKVQHVTVNDGGQAIVGNVSQGVGARQKREGNPMNLVQRMNAAPRCSATSKRSRCQCRAPAVRGWTVCRFHGARGGAPKGKANGAWKHGGYSNEALAARRHCAALIRSAGKIIRKL